MGKRFGIFRKAAGCAVIAAMLAGSAAGYSTSVMAEPEDQYRAEAKNPIVKMGLADLRSLNGGSVTVTANGGAVTFIGGKYYDGLIRDEETALRAVQGLLELLGANASAGVRVSAVNELRDGTVIYTVVRVIEGEDVENGVVKAVVNPDYSPAGLISSIGVFPGGSSQETDGGISRAEAERIAQKNVPGANIISDAGHRVVWPVSKISGIGEESTKFSKDSGVTDLSSDLHYENQVLWCIETDDPSGEADYLNNYVTMDGRYLYSLPGESAADDVSGSEEALDVLDQLYGLGTTKTWSKKVTRHDGNTRTVSVSVIKKEDGTCLLADTERGIVMADRAAFEEKGAVEPLTADDESWDDEAMLIYGAFTKVYDAFCEQGVAGPDNAGSPILLLYGASAADDTERNESGTNGKYISETFQRRGYMGQKLGWQTFSFEKESLIGEDFDTIAAVYSECLARYLEGGECGVNEPGSIRESIEDILGQLVQLVMNPNSDDDKWILGDISGTQYRNMSSPNADGNPRYLWDLGYVPAASVPNEENDYGGISSKAAILDYAAYRMKVRGMETQDELDFWLLLTGSMTPLTGFRETDEIMRWAVVLNGNAELLQKIANLSVYLGFTTDGYPYSAEFGEYAADAVGAGSEMEGSESAAGAGSEADESADSAEEIAEAASETEGAGESAASGRTIIREAARSKQLADGYGAAVFAVRETAVMYYGNPMVCFVSSDGTEYKVWPEEGTGLVAAVLPEGKYSVECTLTSPDLNGQGESAGEKTTLCYTGKGWSDDTGAGAPIEIRSGESCVLTADGLEDYALSGIEYYENSFEAAKKRSESQAEQRENASDEEDDFWDDVADLNA